MQDCSRDFGPRYRYRRRLGQGGASKVFLVHDTQLGSDVALKLLENSPGDGKASQLEREFALLSQVEHGGIARAHDFGYVDGRPYFTSEYVEGQALDELTVPAAAATVVSCAREVASTLAFLHTRSVLHLDVKPGNIIVPRGGRAAVLIDFGLFRSDLSTAPDLPPYGSLPFMAPEYFKGQLPGPWSDIYALGVTLYWLLTGRFPRNHGRQEKSAPPALDWDPTPPLPSELVAALPEDLDRIVLKCLALNPMARYPDGQHLVTALGTRGLGKDRTPSSLSQGGGSLTIGRSAELACLERFLRRVHPSRREGDTEAGPTTLLITGAPGMGHTHFLRESKIRAQTLGFQAFLEVGQPGRPTVPGAVLKCLGAHVGKRDPGSRKRWDAFLARLNRPRSSAARESLAEERRLRRMRELAVAVGDISEPLLLAVDGLQHFDEVSIELLFSLIRLLREARGEPRPLAVIAGFREEGTSSALLKELGAYLLRPDHSEQISLGPLDLPSTLQLARHVGGQDLDDGNRLALFQETAGVPRRVLESLQATPAAGQRSSPSTRAPRVQTSTKLNARERRLLLILTLSRRPCRLSTLTRVTRNSAAECRRSIARLCREQLIVEVEENRHKAWLLAPGATVSLEDSVSACQRIHRALGDELCRTVKDVGDPARREAVEHFQRARANARVVQHGLPVARYLRSTYQNRAALELFAAVLDALPPAGRSRRVDVILELAETHGLLGHFDQGIELLRGALEKSPKAGRGARLRLLLRLASLYSRRGDYRRAATHFEKGLASDKLASAHLTLTDRLCFLNEYAAMKAVLGDIRGAEKLCDDGLRLAGRGRTFSVREAALSLHATRANVALRGFRYEKAIGDFERAMAIAERIGSPVNQAVVLNNLGIAYSNCDRYNEAIRCFSDAERISARLDEGPSLVSIYGNLAVLHAKTGDFASMHSNFEKALELHPSTMGRRQEVFLEHARGLGLIYKGRYAEARTHLENAIRRGKDAGDRLLECFDRVYRAEALIFEGLYAEAFSECGRLSASEMPPRIRKMATARRALLEALLGQGDRVRRTVEQVEGMVVKPPVPFLDAWDQLFLGWAQSITGEETPHMERARGFFQVHELRPALAFANWIEAEGHFLHGRVEKATELLEAADLTNDLVAALQPLLHARILAEIGSSAEDASRCSDLLATASAALVGNPLPEWHLRIRAVRQTLRVAENHSEDEGDDERPRTTRGLPEEWRRPYAESQHWKRWMDFHPRRRPVHRNAKIASGGSPVTTRALTAGEAPTDGLIARSPRMRQLASMLTRLRKSDATVLIHGETGSGKETVARLIHRQSERATYPFLVLDCATLSPSLAEVELFGARAGAFTDLQEDRSGLLAEAEGGTILFDEIGGAAPDVQAKLLRVLGEGTFRPVGTQDSVRVDVRFLFSTSLDVEAEVKKGRLREDLLHRMRVVTIEVPPLRERSEDVAGLVDRFLQDIHSSPTITPDVLSRFQEMPWPGNVRELHNLVTRLALENPDHITVETLERVGGARATENTFPRQLLAKTTLDELQDELEKEYLKHHLHRLGGDTQALSRLLGVGRQQLYRRLRRLGIRLRK